MPRLEMRILQFRSAAFFSKSWNRVIQSFFWSLEQTWSKRHHTCNYTLSFVWLCVSRSTPPSANTNHTRYNSAPVGVSLPPRTRWRHAFISWRMDVRSCGFGRCGRVSTWYCVWIKLTTSICPGRTTFRRKSRIHCPTVVKLSWAFLGPLRTVESFLHLSFARVSASQFRTQGFEYTPTSNTAFTIAAYLGVLFYSWLASHAECGSFISVLLEDMPFAHYDTWCLLRLLSNCISTPIVKYLTPVIFESHFFSERWGEKITDPNTQIFNISYRGRCPFLYFKNPGRCCWEHPCQPHIPGDQPNSRLSPVYNICRGKLLDVTSSYSRRSGSYTYARNPVSRAPV